MSSPYYRFGYQGGRYAFNWHGGAGGVPQGLPAAESRGLGEYDIEESGLTPYSMNFPALRGEEGDTDEPPHVIAPGDWPALRPAGPEPLDPGEGGAPLGFWSGMSDNEQKLLLLGAAGLAAWYFLVRKKPTRRRRNPGRRWGKRGRSRRTNIKWHVAEYWGVDQRPGGRRKVAGRFTTKRAAQDFAARRRRAGKRNVTVAKAPG
jgi:hypothetical protein